MSRILQLFVSLLFVFTLNGCSDTLIGCSEEKPQQVESKKTTEAPAVKTDKHQPEISAAEVFMIQDVKAWKAAKGNTLKAKKKGSVLLTSSLNAPKSAGKTQGAYVMIPNPQAMEQSGKTVQVTLEAAKAKENGAAEFAVAFSTADVGNSGWKKFTPTENFAPYTFEYKVRKCKKCNENFIGVWADTKGAGKGILVKSVSVKTLH